MNEQEYAIAKSMMQLTPILFLGGTHTPQAVYPAALPDCGKLNSKNSLLQIQNELCNGWELVSWPVGHNQSCIFDYLYVKRTPSTGFIVPISRHTMQDT